jgi:hypothetical protein
MSWFPSADRAAPIAASMGVDRPGTIGPAPVGPERSEGRPATAFLFRDAKPKAAEKSRRRSLREDDRGEASASPVFGQTKPIRGRSGSGLKQTDGGNHDMSTCDRSHAFSRTENGIIGPN